MLETQKRLLDVRKSIDNYWKHAYNYITIEHMCAMLLKENL